MSQLKVPSDIHIYWGDIFFSSGTSDILWRRISGIQYHAKHRFVSRQPAVATCLHWRFPCRTKSLHQISEECQSVEGLWKAEVQVDRRSYHLCSEDVSDLVVETNWCFRKEENGGHTPCWAGHLPGDVLCYRQKTVWWRLQRRFLPIAQVQAR